MQKFSGPLDEVNTETITTRLVVCPAGNLDKPATPIFPTVTAGFRAIPISVPISKIGKLFQGCVRTVAPLPGPGTGRARTTLSLSAELTQFLLAFAEVLRLVSGLGKEGCQA